MTLDTYFHLIWCYFRKNYIIFRNADFFKNTFLKEIFLKGIEESFEIFCNILKLSVKSGKRRQANPPISSHRGREFKNRKKKQSTYTGLQQGMKLSAKLSLPCPLFSRTLSTNHCCIPMCTVATNVLKPGAFTPESQYFIPWFNKIPWLAANSQEGMNLKMRGATQAQQGMTLQILITLFCFSKWNLQK
jgi:hypothetical protein